LPELIRSLAAWRPQAGEAGQGLAEYALILGLIAIVAILSLIFLGDTIANLMSYIGDTIDRNT
jgi:Flp pilus assembly pilin Flp